ncbi:MAG: MBL fold metallo-hydrolase [archaeon]
MIITRYAQSCVLIETNGKRILTDPGYLNYDESLLEKWNKIDILLVTHKHKDHCHIPAILAILKNPKTMFYASQEVATAYPEIKNTVVVKEKDIVRLGDIKITVTKAVHGYIPSLKGGNEVKENLGFIIDDGKNKAYLTSDTICFENDYKCDILLAPISGHGLVMGPFEAALFAKEAGAKAIIPIHLDNPKYPVDMKKAKEEIEKQGIRCELLNIGESLKI